MVVFKKPIIICLIILVDINFAQTTNVTNLAKIDTSKQKSQYIIIEKQSLHLDELKFFYNNYLNKQTFYIPNYQIIHPNTYGLSNYNYSIKNYDIVNEFDSFNESLNKLLTKEYEKMGKYDLRTFGRYLGIADNIITIILWILSFNDFLKKSYISGGIFSHYNLF